MLRKTKLSAIAAASATVSLAAAPASASGPWTQNHISATAVVSGYTGLLIETAFSTTNICTGSALGGIVGGTPNGGSDAVFLIRTAAAYGCFAPITLTGLPWNGAFVGGLAHLEFSMTSAGCPYYGTLTGTISGHTATFTRQAVNSPNLACPGNVTVSVTYNFTQP